MGFQRLQKIIAAAGVDSRRKCEELILSGAVSVNGRVVEMLPAFADPDKDIITVNGRKIAQAKKVYYLLNKPKGVPGTNVDSQGRPTVVDIIQSALGGGRERLFCIGKLDADTKGLIILTNDSELASRLTNPRYRVVRTYIAEVEGRVLPEHVEKMKKGVWLSDGRTGPATVKILNRGFRRTFVEITITQGLNRPARRMLAKVGLKVKSLKRIKIGKIISSGIGVGKVRHLKHSEVAYLKKITET